MRIDKIAKITNYRIFRDFEWGDLTEFGRSNVIYGWNGSGKTALSDLFRIIERHESLPSGLGEVTFVIDGREVDLRDPATSALPQIRVFNRDSIPQAIFDKPDGALPHIFYIGHDSANFEREIARLERELAEAVKRADEVTTDADKADRALTTFCKDTAQSIKTLLTTAGGGPYNNYARPDFERCARKLVLSPVEPLSDAEREQLLTLKDEETKAGLDVPDIPESGITNLIAKSAELLSENITSTVIASLTEDPKLSAWLQDGLSLHEDRHSTDCLFCGNPVKSERLKALQAHFNDEFSDFQLRIGDNIEQMRIMTSHLQRQALPKPIELLSPFRNRYSSAVSQLGAQSAMIAAFLESIEGALKEKKASPFRDVTMPLFSGIHDKSGNVNWRSVIAAGLGIFAVLFTENALTTVATIVQEHNRAVDGLREQKDAAREKLEIDAVANVLDRFKELEEEKISASQTAEREQERQRNLEADLSEFQSKARSTHLAAGELTRDVSRYLGRNELTFEDSGTGYIIKRRGKPATKLSEGERTGITFLHFLKSLKDDGFDIKNGIVVIDDPISSLDANAIYGAFGFMKEVLADAGQIFILTHNFRFFRQVKNWYGHLMRYKRKNPGRNPIGYYMLQTSTDSDGRLSRIANLDPLLKDFESEYHYLFNLVLSLTQATTGPDGIAAYYAMPNVARRLLESFLAFKSPSSDGSLFSKLEDVDVDINKARLLRFLDEKSHDDEIPEPEHDLSILVETPLILAELLTLMEAVDGDHVNAMKERCLAN